MPTPRHTKAPIADRAWMAKAACHSAGTDQSEWWFSTRSKDVMRAIEVCRRCPASAACHDYALKTKATYGVWSGRILHKIRQPSKALLQLLEE